MHIFRFRDQLIHDYAAYTASFIQIRDQKIKEYVEQSLGAGGRLRTPAVPTADVPWGEGGSAV